MLELFSFYWTTASKSIILRKEVSIYLEDERLVHDPMYASL